MFVNPHIGQVLFEGFYPKETSLHLKSMTHVSNMHKKPSKPSQTTWISIIRMLSYQRSLLSFFSSDC